jgi:filamentous hemagglutinin family protein
MTTPSFRFLFTALLSVALPGLPLRAQGGAPIDPTPSVVAGAVDFAGLATPHAVITQGTAKAIVDYTHFNVLPGGSVQFVQPGADAAILNRITGAVPSIIDGLVTANGQVFFVNPAGVTFGEGSVIRADTFLAAAGQWRDEDFLAGRMDLTLTGAVAHHGSIATEREASLLGRQVFNAGEIVSARGVAVLASGDRVFLQPVGSSLLVEVATDATVPADGVGLDNAGAVAGEDILFAAGDAFAMALRHTGTATATRTAKLHSDGGAIEVGGAVTARGGRIEIGGTDRGGPAAPRARETTVMPGALVDVSAETTGDGGSVVIWADERTSMLGAIRGEGAAGGRGAAVEISAARVEMSEGLWDITLGEGGSLLFDPLDVTIDAPAATNIVTQMNAGTSVTVDTDAAPFGGAGAEAGDITIAAQIQVTNTTNQASLTLNAARDIIVNQRVTSLQPVAGGSVFNFTAGRNIIVNALLQSALSSTSTIRLEAPSGTITLDGGGAIDAGGSGVFLRGDQGITLRTGTQVLAGINASVDNHVTLRADNGVVSFNGGLVQLFGATDATVVARRFINATGVNAITAIGGAGFWQIALPHPYGETATTNPHAYGGLQSNNPAVYASPGTADPVRNEYHYAFQPVIDVTANADAKIYGDAPNAGFAGVTIDATDLINAASFGGVFTQDTLGSSVLGTAVLSSPGAPTNAPVADYAITPSGFSSSNGYAFNYLDGTLTVNPRPVVLTAREQSKTYGDPLVFDDTAFTVLDKDGDALLPNGETIDTLVLASATGADASTTAAAGRFVDEITVTGQAGSSGFDALNYVFTYVPGDLVVNPRPITVTAGPQDKFYGSPATLADTVFTVLDVDGDALLPNGESLDTVTVVSLTGKDLSTIAAAATYTDELQPTAVAGSGGFAVANYAITFVNGDFQILPRPVTLSASGQRKDYGDVLPLGTTAFTLTDLDGDALLPNGETISAVSFVSQTGAAASTTSAVGTYAGEIRVTGQTGANGFNAANYALTYVDGDLMVDPRPITVTATAQEKVYGDPLVLDPTAFTVLDKDGDAALPNGETIDAAVLLSQTGGALSTTAAAGTYPVEIRPTAVNGSSGFVAGNYAITMVDGALVIQPRAVTLTALPQDKIYGNGLALDPTAFSLLDKDGDALLPNGEVIDTVGLLSQTGVDASTTASVGTYAGEIGITGQAGSNGFDAANYTFTYVSGALRVDPRAVTLTALPQGKDYGDPLDLDGTAFSVLDLDGDSALPNGERLDTVALISRGGVAASTTAAVGAYADEIRITGQTGSAGFDAANYSFTYVDGDLSIAPRALVLTASPQGKTYGNTLVPNPTAFTVLDKDGDAILPNGETLTAVDLLSRTGIAASTTAPAGTYAGELEITGQTGANGFTASNYAISYLPGTLTVGTRAVTLAASPQGKTYGDVLLLDGTAFTLLDADGDAILPNGETVTTVLLTSRTGRAAATAAGVGTYAGEIAITGQSGTGGFAATNYSFTYVDGDLSVSPRPMTLTALPQGKVYGNTGALDGTAFSVTDRDGGSSLPNGETVTGVSLSSVAGNAPTAPVGTYADDLSITGQTGGNGFNAANYTITTVPGDFSVARRAITLTASDRERLFFQALADDPTAFTVTDADGDSSLPNGERIDTAIIVSAGGTATNLTALPGLYPANLTITGQSGAAGFDPANYTISYLPGDLTITGSVAPSAAFAEAFNEEWEDLSGMVRVEEPDDAAGFDPSASLLTLFGDPDWHTLTAAQRNWLLRQFDRTPPDQLSADYLLHLLGAAKVQ